MQVISFKLDDAVAAKLESRAAVLGLPSKHAVAKEMVLATLTNAYQSQLVNAIQEVDTKVWELKYVMATAVSALLQVAGKVEDPAEADRWVRNNFFGVDVPDEADDGSPKDEKRGQP